MATGNILAQGNIDKWMIVSGSMNPPSVGAQTSGTATMTVPGVRLGDFVVCAIPSQNLNAGMGISHAWVSAADTISVRIINATAGALDPVAATYNFLLVRPEDATLPAAPGWLY